MCGLFVCGESSGEIVKNLYGKERKISVGKGFYGKENKRKKLTVLEWGESFGG